MKVIDANVIIHGRGLEGKMVTIPEVMDELKSRDANISLHSFNVEKLRCSEENLEKVKEKSREINAKTSEVDEKLLALALDLDEVLVTDDKELQNLGLHLEADIEGFLDSVTDKKMAWKMVCSSCGKASECNCGSSLERRLDQCSSV